jgi:hypothetical protein
MSRSVWGWRVLKYNMKVAGPQIRGFDGNIGDLDELPPEGGTLEEDQRSVFSSSSYY